MKETASGAPRGGGTAPAGAEEGTGLAVLPQDERHAFIRWQYPEPSGEQAALVRLLLGGRSAAASPDGKLLKGLAGAGYVGRRGGRLCLTELGEYAARGTLSIYPELEEAPADARPTGGAGRRARQPAKNGPVPRVLPYAPVGHGPGPHPVV